MEHLAKTHLGIDHQELPYRVDVAENTREALVQDFP